MCHVRDATPLATLLSVEVDRVRERAVEAIREEWLILAHRIRLGHVRTSSTLRKREGKYQTAERPK